MSDKQSIRDDLIGELDKATDYYGRAYNGYGQLANHLLSSPVIRRIEAEAFEQGKQAGFTQADGEWRTERDHYSQAAESIKDDLARAEETIEQVRAWRRSKDLRGQLPDSAHEELIAILAAHTKENS